MTSVEYFEKWFNSKDWEQPDTRREEFRKYWDILICNSCWYVDDIEDFFDDIIASVRDEYGE